ncbi:EEF1A lysine methyltransferase 1 isoform X2 [Macaca nemestrina]|uniref:EEF1A lysine methyltransferase 1 n=3 Tax=Macaca TaxID=9539 RepID=I2CY46_MACMU|nr:EEF1A lysine methyltransferase 1 isoform X3 [Macaca fascicularis]XP_024651322.1 EEF1A lysine methyltransferase 1 isoform X2 [Macaca nemestrina]XP_045232857.1 EEF1A lysine methyltransferase 1 isoform X3 [Macaca fascicularis]XP_045232858.1 EEF1A lysine methyltransferase 1 isoform X3 [Macaca fascicularis]XP_050622716.1 EEF1A lysine methyltransferase 1 isoform X2 [Macaca thibetana thibetana]XP_050622718.1 EEF1A lysine methyltransferase 1 isoform X2 [Macaca thibetana thibetana]
MSDLEDDETPQLSAHALAALQEFYAEQKQQIDLGEDDKYNIGIIEENWQLSQFWYSQETALRLAQEAIAAVGEGGRIACVSAPSVYQKLRELCRENFTVYIFEYDKRFAMYGEEFIFYDYNNPLDLPERIAAHSFDIVIADPPYLSEECLRKTSETIKYLTRGKILLCTGAIMEEQAAELLGVKMCTFVPKHTRNLANEFRCYVNYDSGLDCGI